MDPTTGALLFQIAPKGEVNALAFSPDGHRLVVGDSKGKVIMLSGPASTPFAVSLIPLDTAVCSAERWPPLLRSSCCSRRCWFRRHRCHESRTTTKGRLARMRKEPSREPWLHGRHQPIARRCPRAACHCF